MSDEDYLDVSVQVSTQSIWLELNDRVVFEVTADSFREKATTQRTVQAGNQFLEGSFTVNALRENVMEVVGVYVRAPDHFTLDVRINEVTDAFDQPFYRIIRRVENSWQVWFCGAAGYRIETGQEYLHAKMAKITFEIPRHPVVELDSDEACLMFTYQGRSLLLQNLMTQDAAISLDALFIALVRTPVLPTDDGDSINEIQGSGYARAPVAANELYWTLQAYGELCNALAIYWNPAPEPWGAVSGWALCTLSSGGDCIAGGDFMETVDVDTLDVVSLAPGMLVLEVL